MMDTQDDELVKHMSNLPGYLKHLDRGPNVHENALNVGVLDWGRLEKWRHNQRYLPAGMDASSNSRDSLLQKTTGSFLKDDLPRVSKHSTHRVKHFQYSETASMRNCTFRPFSEIHEDIMIKKMRQDLDRKDPSEFSEPRTTSDENLVDENHHICSYCFLPAEFHTAELSSDALPTCPLSSRSETNTEPDNMSHIMLSDQRAKISYNTSWMPPFSSNLPSMLSEGKQAEPNKVNIKPTDSKSAERLKILDQETAELEATKGRNSMANHRFSFSQMGRSISFKEGSVIPVFRSSTYVSVKSAPVRFAASAFLDNSTKEKANALKRAKSIPLRRLLDPLLKSKAANTAHSSETVQPSKIKSNSRIFRYMYPCESLQNHKCDQSHVQALLHFTIKNGLPLFKFVVNNNSNVLAATINDFPTSGKDNFLQNFTFYSLNKIKRKSGGWISQAKKSKSCGYVYSNVGLMKDSISFHGRKSCNQFMVRESILYGVELTQEDQELPRSRRNEELAAIVVKIPIRNLSHGGVPCIRDKDLKEKDFTDDKCSCNLGDNKDANSIIVILPGGVHGIPNKGVPSPLIDRWKSGGSCDCGGWDVGCKLRILSNNIPGASKPSLNPDHLELFIQEGAALQDRPIFSLASLKNGIYSTEFSASIPLIQAFFICVAVVNCQSPYDLSEVSKSSEVKVTSDENNETESPTISEGDIPAEYVLYPPLSPVGRV